MFELPVLEESSSSSDSETEQGKFELDRDAMPAQKPKEHFITINDILPDDNVYGPRIPESLPDGLASQISVIYHLLAIPVEEKIKITPIAPHPEVVTLESSDESTDGDYHRSSKKRRRSEGRKKEKHRHKSKHKDRNGKVSELSSPYMSVFSPRSQRSDDAILLNDQTCLINRLQLK